MKKFIVLLFVFFISTSYRENTQKMNFEYSEEIQEIKENLSQARKDLNEVSIVVKDEKTLRKVKRKIKRDR